MYQKVEYVCRLAIMIFFCSVAHGEEYYNACCNASTEYIEAAFEVKKTINNISKKGIVLNPAKRGVRAKAEKFEDCIDRIENLIQEIL